MGSYHLRIFGYAGGEYQGVRKIEDVDSLSEFSAEQLRNSADLIGDNFFCSYQSVNDAQECSSIHGGILVSIAKAETQYTEVNVVANLGSVGAGQGYFMLYDVSSRYDTLIVASAWDAEDQGFVASNIAGEWDVQMVTVSRELEHDGVTVETGTLSCTQEFCRGAREFGGMLGVLEHEHGFSGPVGNSVLEFVSITTSPSGNILVAVHRHPDDYSQVHVVFGVRK
ncbi:hypothetical protein CHH28_07385 [Bacterioplanes sanyensis]|uniref:Uncharacterized protein n=2 Tax=Bacterioplanes sanyensis TaxID=1249553 RepID=A0A222FJ32_9GAMM|nr:hypothetical protein CHH28_07385 [Bacterioplanes sanyensis]